jgi:hypothetical protein
MNRLNLDEHALVHRKGHLHEHSEFVRLDDDLILKLLSVYDHPLQVLPLQQYGVLTSVGLILLKVNP